LDEEKNAKIGQGSEFGAKPKFGVLCLLHLNFYWHQEKLRWSNKKKIKL
jgi:hypothetical protein